MKDFVTHILVGFRCADFNLTSSNFCSMFFKMHCLNKLFKHEDGKEQIRRRRKKEVKTASETRKLGTNRNDNNAKIEEMSNFKVCIVKKRMSSSLCSNTISTPMTMLVMTLKVNNVELRLQTAKQIDDVQKECTSHFMMMKMTIIGQNTKSEKTSIESKQDPVVIESNDAKVKVNA